MLSLFNRTFWIVLIAFLAVMIAVPLIAPGTGEMANDEAGMKYMSELSEKWGSWSRTYLTLSLPGMDWGPPVVAALTGCVVVFGVDIMIRRRTDSVIKRLFTQDKDNGRH